MIGWTILGRHSCRFRDGCVKGPTLSHTFHLFICEVFLGRFGNISSGDIRLYLIHLGCYSKLNRNTKLTWPQLLAIIRFMIYYLILEIWIWFSSRNVMIKNLNEPIYNIPL